MYVYIYMCTYVYTDIFVCMRACGSVSNLHLTTYLNGHPSQQKQIDFTDRNLLAFGAGGSPVKLPHHSHKASGALLDKPGRCPPVKYSPEYSFV